MKQIPGGNILLKVGDNVVGHCSSHTVNTNAETRELAFKRPATDTNVNDPMFKDKEVSTLACSISADGVCYVGETEGGYNAFMGALMKGEPMTVESFMRGNDTAAFLTGSFIVTSCQLTAGQGEGAKYSIQLENTGAFTFAGTNFAYKNS